MPSDLSFSPLPPRRGPAVGSAAAARSAVWRLACWQGPGPTLSLGFVAGRGERCVGVVNENSYLECEARRLPERNEEAWLPIFIAEYYNHAGRTYTVP